MSLIEKIQNNEFFIFAKEDFKQLMFEIKNSAGNGIERKFCSTSEAMRILDLKKDKFRDLANSKETLLIKSKIKGKWNLNSVYREAERLNEI